MCPSLCFYLNLCQGMLGTKLKPLDEEVFGLTYAYIQGNTLCSDCSSWESSSYGVSDPETDSDRHCHCVGNRPRPIHMAYIYGLYIWPIYLVVSG